MYFLVTFLRGIMVGVERGRQTLASGGGIYVFLVLQQINLPSLGGFLQMGQF